MNTDKLKELALAHSPADSYQTEMRSGITKEDEEFIIGLVITIVFAFIFPCTLFIMFALLAKGVI